MWSLQASAAPEGTPAPIHVTAPDLELISIPAGTFRMGSDEKDPERAPSELKVTTVTISQPFWLGKTEVTRAQWEAVMGPVTEPTFIGSPKDLKELAGDLPMADVTWGQAISFCDKLTQREREAGRLKAGYVYSLPSEAQWEYACRAGATGLVPVSTTERDASIWYMKTAGPWTYSMGARLNPVGKKKANAWGLYDMLGNLSEWTLDQYDPAAYDKLADGAKDPTVPPAGKYPRVARGGSYLDDAGVLRCSNRIASSPEWNKRDPQVPKSRWWLTDGMFMGFRVVRPVQQPSKEEIEKFYASYLK